MQSVVISHDGSTCMDATLSWLVPLLGRSRAHVELCATAQGTSNRRLEGLVARLREAGATATTRSDLPGADAAPGQLVVLHGGGRPALRLLRETRASLFVTPEGLEPFAPRRILVPLDGSKRAEAILPLVTTFSQAFDAEVVLQRIAPDESSEGALKSRPNQVSTRLNLKYSLVKALFRLEQAGCRVKLRLDRHGNLDQRILEGAQRCGADLIAVSTHGHGRLARWLLGSNAERLLRRSPVPLLVRNAS